MKTTNIGGADTAIRAVLGILFMVWAAVVADSHPFLAFGAALVTTVILATAIAGACPLYTALGLDTHARPRPQPQPRPRIDVRRERRNSCDKRRLITTKQSERPVQKSFMFPGSSRPGGLPARASALGH